jgi:hypothetical protein
MAAATRWIVRRLAARFLLSCRFMSDSANRPRLRSRARPLLRSAALAVVTVVTTGCDEDSPPDDPSHQAAGRGGDGGTGGFIASNPKGSLYDSGMGGRGGTGGTGGFIASNPKGSLYDSGMDAGDQDAGED